MLVWDFIFDIGLCNWYHFKGNLLQIIIKSLLEQFLQYPLCYKLRNIEGYAKIAKKSNFESIELVAMDLFP